MRLLALFLVIGVLVSAGSTALAQTPAWSPSRPLGLVCNGVADDTLAIQNAVNAAKSGTTGLRLTLPLGATCLLSDSVVMSSVSGMVMDGNHATFQWRGNTTVPMFILRDVRDSVLQHFSVLTSTAHQLATVFQLENGSGGAVVPTRNRFEDLQVECTDGGCGVIVRMAQGAGGDNNNEFTHVVHVRGSNYSEAFAKIEHSQSKHNLFQDIGCSGNGVGQYCISVTPKGSFSCLNCAGGGHTIADFYLADYEDTIVIQAANMENSSRFILADGPTGATMPAVITGSRWALSASMHADNRVVVWQSRGPLVLMGNTFEPGTAGKALELYFQPGGNTGGWVSIGNYISSTLTNPYTGVQPTMSVGNVINRNDAAVNTLLDMSLRLGGSVVAAALSAAPYNTATNGHVLYCSDCTIASPCAGGGTGALAKRLNAQWICN
jgi:hypothetical protein